MKFKRAAGAVLFILGLIALLGAASYVVLPRDNTKAAGMEEPEANGVMAEPEETIDIIVLGDSESYTSISPLQIWRETGYTSYVCGTASQQLTYSKTMLQRALKTQSPKLVILETLAIYRKMTPGDIGLNEAADLLPVFRYHNRWKTLNWGDIFGPVKARRPGPYKGHLIYTGIKPCSPGDYMSHTGAVEEIPFPNRLFVRAIKELCDRNGAKLLLLSTPSCVNWNRARHNGISALADELGCEYLDLNLKNAEIGIDWSTDTHDAGDHLNQNGAHKVTRFLSGYLRGTGLFTDRRGDADFSSWHTSLKQYEEALSNAG